MRAFAQEQNQPQGRVSSRDAPPKPATSAPARLTNYILHLQRTIGNQAVQRLLRAQSNGPETESGVEATARFADERMPPILGGQEKSVSWKGIKDEDEPTKKHAAAEKCGCGEEDKRVGEKAGITRSEGLPADSPKAEPEVETRIQTMRGDRPLTSSEHRFMEPRFGANFSAISAALSLVQRDPAPPPPAPVAAPAGVAALNFLPVIKDQAPADWGITVEDDAIIDITAFAGGVWKCVITTADQQSHQGVRLLPGVVEVTPALVAAEASCPTLQTMITSLDSVANQGADSGFYMLSAVQAHEDLHNTQYRTSFAPHYPTLKTAVEKLTVPLASQPDAAAAKAAIKALPAFTAAMAAFHAADVAANNATGSHTPIAPFKAAEHGVVDPMIATIKARRTALKCAP